MNEWVAIPPSDPTAADPMAAAREALRAFMPELFDKTPLWEMSVCPGSGCKSWDAPLSMSNGQPCNSLWHADKAKAAPGGAKAKEA